ncbi:uncharacterized protein [Diabrotica undecimpunctata]|uniref:uncharacterized protein isoform X2 n=1 Tax=Diabrotica undecimpunctata TaxID=50387 RepID=UPI003B640698
MKTFILTLSLLALVYGNQEDYLKWVSYNGEIPEGAVPAGMDANNNTVYIGRVHLTTNTKTEGFVPGNIIPGVVSLDTVLFNKVYTVTKNIEILITVNNPKLEWILVKYYQFPKLFDDEHFHVARVGWEQEGNEFNSTTYLGRIQFNDRTNIGKVFTSANFYAENNELYFPVNGKTKTGYVFEALVYYY